MTRWARRSAVLTISLAVGLIMPTASAADNSPDPIVEQKQQVLTPGLQRLTDQPPAPTGRVRLPASASDQPGTPITKRGGRVLVDLRLSSTAPRVLDRLRSAGARITFVDRALSTVTAAVEPSDLPSLTSANPELISAREVLRPMTNAACPSGTFVSEGVEQLRAALARAQFAVDGSGVTVGVLSDSYDQLGGAATDVGNGELPGTANPCGQTNPVANLAEGAAGSIDEGRAMAQIIHDVAPGAKILFATAFKGQSAFAQSIRDLAQAGADVIVDDVTYFTEPMFQDGVIAKAVSDVTAQGVVYFSSAGNSNKDINSNRVASYEAPAFRPMSCPAAVTTFYGEAPITCHDFDPGPSSDASYNLAVTSLLRYSLGWSEPQNGVTTDLDLCLVDSTSANVYGCAADDNGLTGLASEYSTWDITGNPGAAWVIVRFSGTSTPRLKLISHRSGLTAVEYSTGTGGDIVGPTIFGHNASIPGVTVGAVPFNDSSTLELFSSFGPALYCWQPVDGTTPSAPLTPCQSATVDISATDGTQNSFFGSNIGGTWRFYGTSAAAPHAAAVAALMLEGQSCLTPDSIKSALSASGRTVDAAPVDGAGAGLIDATAAVTAGDCTPPTVRTGISPGWYRSAAVSATASAEDNRVVDALSCTGVNTQTPAGLNTRQASVAWSVSGEGKHTVTCTARDLKGNEVPASVKFGIDSKPPTIVCRPLTVPLRGTRTLTADVSDAVSGPVSTTVSANVVTNNPGTFATELSGADVAGNTASASCGYTVKVVPRLTGPAKAKAGQSRRYRVSGLPGKATVKWTVKRKGKKFLSKKTRANSSGGARLKVKFTKKGKYTVSMKSAGASAGMKVRVR